MEFARSALSSGVVRENIGSFLEKVLEGFSSLGRASKSAPFGAHKKTGAKSPGLKFSARR
jgi:hypothetical protein